MANKVIAMNGYEITINQLDLEAGASFLFSVKDLRQEQRIEPQVAVINTKYKDDFIAFL